MHILFKALLISLVITIQSSMTALALPVVNNPEEKLPIPTATPTPLPICPTNCLLTQGCNQCCPSGYAPSLSATGSLVCTSPCPGNQILSANGSCSCAAGLVLAGVNCLTPCAIAGQSYNSSGVCACPSGQNVLQNPGTGALYCGTSPCYRRIRIRNEGYGGLGTMLQGTPDTCLQSILAFGNILCHYPGSQNYDDCLANMILGASGLSPYIGNRSMDLYYDANCARTTAPSGQLCADIYFGYRFTPISLVFKKNTSLDTATITDFPLDPRESGKWYTWKGTDETPLLVYDPLKTGRVTGADSLFGHFTFGGKKFASLETDSETSSLWRNGFEALSSLDENADGEISGRELAPLALWFDRNENGISEIGEVREIQSEGIKALYYTVDYSDPEGNLWVNVGYARYINGKVVSGSAVDWLAESADSPLELIHKLIARSRNKAGKTSKEQIHDDRLTVTRAVNTQNSLDSNNSSDLPNLNGLWRWKSSGSKKQSDGYLSFSERPDGGIRGHSYASLTFPEGLDIKGKITAFLFNGVTSVNEHGLKELSFQIIDEAANATLLSAASMVDENTLAGKTQVTFTRGTAKKVFSYDWKASRVVDPSAP